MKSLNLIILFTAASLPLAAFADQPLGPPEETRTCDYTYSFCAYSDPEAVETTVYSISEDFQKTQLYKFDGWFRHPFLSTDGRHFVAAYDGLNLIPKDYSPDMVMISIFEEGKLVREVKLKELFRSLESLEETASHYNWGRVFSFSMCSW